MLNAMHEDSVSRGLLKYENGGVVNSRWLDKYEDGGTTEDPPQLLPNNYKVNYQTPITASDIKEPSGYRQNIASNDNTSTTKPFDQTTVPQVPTKYRLPTGEVVNVQPSQVISTDQKFTKDYFGDPSISSLVNNGISNMNQIPIVRTAEDIINAGMIGEAGLGVLKLGQVGAKTAGKYLVENTALKILIN